MSNIQFPATASWTNWDFVTVYASVYPGASSLGLQSTSSNGLPNIDSLEVIGGDVIPPPQLGVASVSNGQMAMQVNGVSRLKLQIQSSINLLDWNTVLTTNSPAMPFIWTNNISDSPMNFFRVLGPPF